MFGIWFTWRVERTRIPRVLRTPILVKVEIVGFFIYIYLKKKQRYKNVHGKSKLLICLFYDDVLGVSECNYMKRKKKIHFFHG